MVAHIAVLSRSETEVKNDMRFADRDSCLHLHKYALDSTIFSMGKKPIIIVIDGLGGGIGAQLCAKIHQALGEQIELFALGTNSSATEQMLKAGADRGASGENAIRVSVGVAQAILGPIGIVLPDSMMGEVTASMAQAIMDAHGKKILLPVNQPHFVLAGVSTTALARVIDEAVAHLVSDLADMIETP